MTELLTTFMAPLSSMALISLLYVISLLITVSQRLGAMTKMKPYYRWLYISGLCVAVALLIRLQRTSVFLAPGVHTPLLLNSPVFDLALYYLPLSVGLTIALVVTVRYWGWLLQSQS